MKSATKSSEVKVERFTSERKNKSNTNMRLCTGCKRFISGRNIRRHQTECCGEKPLPVDPLAMLRKACCGEKPLPVNPLAMLCQSNKDREFGKGKSCRNFATLRLGRYALPTLLSSRLAKTGVVPERCPSLTSTSKH